MDTSDNPVNRILLRCVLKDVSPLIVRVISIADDLEIRDLHAMVHTLFVNYASHRPNNWGFYPTGGSPRWTLCALIVGAAVLGLQKSLDKTEIRSGIISLSFEFNLSEPV